MNTPTPEFTDSDHRRVANGSLNLRRAAANATYNEGFNAVSQLHTLAIESGADTALVNELYHDIVGALVQLQDQIVIELRIQKEMLSKMTTAQITGIEDPLYPKGEERLTSVPEGYVLVPIVPTDAMVDAGSHSCPQPQVQCSAYGEGTWWESRPYSTLDPQTRKVWEAMLKASDKPEAISLESEPDAYLVQYLDKHGNRWEHHWYVPQFGEPAPTLLHGEPIKVGSAILGTYHVVRFKKMS